LSALAEAGTLSATGVTGEYRCDQPLDAAELERTVATALRAIEATGVDRVFLDYLRDCAANQVGLLRGEVSPLQLLLPDEAGLVTDALYAANPSSRIQNLVAARLVRALADRLPDGDRLRIVEVGAGTGATSAAILNAVPGDRVRYRFTDISTFFTNRARRLLAGHPSVEYGVYDIDREPAEQGLPPGGADIVVAANVLHDAKDLDWTLARLRCVLAPGGVLVLIEGTANSLIQLISVGFIEGFAHHQDRYELPLRPVRRWRDGLRQAGFGRFAALPAGDPVCAAMPQHVMVAAAPGGGAPLDPDRLRRALAALLPEYMVPRHYLLIDRIPLSANGKVDRAALPAPWSGSAGQEPVAPRDDLEGRLLGIWREVLERADFGVEDSFFELGGDSLHAVRILARLREEFGVELTANEGLQMLFDRPSVTGLAGTLRGLETRA
jgi:SAM-dependent methyltransferase